MNTEPLRIWQKTVKELLCQTASGLNGAVSFITPLFALDSLFQKKIFGKLCWKAATCNTKEHERRRRRFWDALKASEVLMANFLEWDAQNRFTGFTLFPLLVV
jgi:hypothetical protein